MSSSVRLPGVGQNKASRASTAVKNSVRLPGVGQNKASRASTAVKNSAPFSAFSFYSIPFVYIFIQHDMMFVMNSQSDSMDFATPCGVKVYNSTNDFFFYAFF